MLSAVLRASGFSNTTAKMLMASGNQFLWLGVMGAFNVIWFALRTRGHVRALA